MSSKVKIHHTYSPEFNIERIEVLDDNISHYDLLLPFNIENGKEYFVLSVIYNTGDSFQHNERESMEIIDVYCNYDIAEKNAKAIRYHDNYINNWVGNIFLRYNDFEKLDKNHQEYILNDFGGVFPEPPSSFTKPIIVPWSEQPLKNSQYRELYVEIENEDGTTKWVSCPWTGHFESIAEIAIQKISTIASKMTF